MPSRKNQMESMLLVYDDDDDEWWLLNKFKIIKEVRKTANCVWKRNFAQKIKPNQLNMFTTWKKNCPLYFIRKIRSPYRRKHFNSRPCFISTLITSLSVNKILLPRYTNWSTNFRALLFIEEIILVNHDENAKLCSVAFQLLWVI